MRSVKSPRGLDGYVQYLVYRKVGGSLDDFVDGLSFDKLSKDGNLHLHGSKELAPDEIGMVR